MTEVPAECMEMGIPVHMVQMLLAQGLSIFAVAGIAVLVCGGVGAFVTAVTRMGLDLIPWVHVKRAKGDPKWWQALMRALPFVASFVASLWVWPLGWWWVIGLTGGFFAPFVVWGLKRLRNVAEKVAAAKMDALVQSKVL